MNVKTRAINCGTDQDRAEALARRMNRKPGTIAVAERNVYLPHLWQVRYADNVPAGYVLTGF